MKKVYLLCTGCTNPAAFFQHEEFSRSNPKVYNNMNVQKWWGLKLILYFSEVYHYMYLNLTFNFLWINFNWIQTNKHHLTCNSQNLASWSKKFSFILVKAWKEKIFQVFEFTIIIVFEKNHDMLGTSDYIQFVVIERI